MVHIAALRSLRQLTACLPQCATEYRSQLGSDCWIPLLLDWTKGSILWVDQQQQAPPELLVGRVIGLKS